MSHVAALLTKLKVRQLLIEAISACGYSYAENGRILNEYRDVTIPVDISVCLDVPKKEHAYGEFGYQKNQDGVYAVKYYVSHDVIGKVKRIACAYSDLLLRKQMNKNKFMYCGTEIKSGCRVLRFCKDTATILATIAENGDVTIETKGYKGKSCLDATQQLEIAIGSVAKMTKKPEFYEPPPPARIVPMIQVNGADLCG